MSDKASMDFAGQSLGGVLSGVVEEKGAKLGRVILQKTTMLILRETVKNTRVDTGALRNNWQVSRNLRNRSKDTGSSSKTGQQAISDGRRKVKNIRLTDIVFIQNNLEYASHWERVDKMLKESVRKVTANLEKNLDKTRL